MKWQIEKESTVLFKEKVKKEIYILVRFVALPSELKGIIF